ncbi:hypothetical protein N7532_007967 [Penicillium argentinense]|uniref:Uncharacterized protein n=1 Tax=Penicillium argentinense TaxID=1131581 RepID=A0A9W9EWF4_9EURO|nr:uncharacterized protein N7532_007967 [Penicillium argentinense]KAJ5089283.1 hypothetical protein N7532_007967 [Penicillium argentinense]
MPSDTNPSTSLTEGGSGAGVTDDDVVSSNTPTARQRLRAKDISIVPGSTPTSPIVISPNGDIILEYIAMSSEKSHYWQVSSEQLISGSPYFGAMLDSNKFMEGRLLAQQRRALTEGANLNTRDTLADKIDSASLATLPIVKIPSSPKSELCGIEAIQLFLKILCLDILDPEAKSAFHNDLAVLPPSLVAKLIDISEWFNSIKPVRRVLQEANYRGGVKWKPAVSTKVFNLDMLKMKERRVREMIVISAFIGLKDILKAMTHTLIIIGSKFWQQGLERPKTEEYSNWKYLPDGLEEELYHRRQRVLNTLTDLQAHFLRSYGGLERDESDRKPNTIGPTTSYRPPELQCRNGLANGMQCDVFHLGQMLRFFALRTKTVFLGSTLIDPDFSIEESDPDEPLEQNTSGKAAVSSDEPQFAINQVIAGLKQYPDYQVDHNHVGCGIRRRLLPILDGIEKFIADNRGLLGVQASLWESLETRALSAWSGRGAPKNHTIEIRFSKITRIVTPSGARTDQFSSQEDQARLMFTAAKYKWEA